MNHLFAEKGLLAVNISLVGIRSARGLFNTICLPIVICKEVVAMGVA